jgi:hypothetical protein
MRTGGELRDSGTEELRDLGIRELRNSRIEDCRLTNDKVYPPSATPEATKAQMSNECQNPNAK